MKKEAKKDTPVWFSKFISWIAYRYDIISNIISAALSIGSSLFAASLYESMKNASNSSADIFILCTLGVIVFCVIVLYSMFSCWIKNKLVIKDYKYKDYIEKAYLEIQDLSFKSQEKLQEIVTSPIDSNKLLNWSFGGLKLVVQKCYDFFIASYGEAKEFIETTRFEVTFMTKSYNDGGLTIAAWANRENQKPISMLNRDNNIDCYKDTVAARLYREYHENKQPQMVIVSDTKEVIKTKGTEVPEGRDRTEGAEGAEGAEGTYKELYPGQLDKSKSSIIVPVFSRKYELLGVLVVYCNKTGFFREDDRQFWKRMTELFTDEIGTYKLILDVLAKEGKTLF